MTGLFCTSTFLCLRDPDTDKIGSEPGALERTLQSLSRSPLRSSRHRSYTACEMFYLTMTTNTSPCVSIMAAQYPLLLLRTELTFPTVLDIQVVWSLAHHSSAFQMDCSNYRVIRNRWMNGLLPSKPYHHWWYVSIIISCAFNRYETGPHRLNIHLFNYC